MARQDQRALRCLLYMPDKGRNRRRVIGDTLDLRDAAKDQAARAGGRENGECGIAYGIG